jgi:hypothetical protein
LAFLYVSTDLSTIPGIHPLPLTPATAVDASTVNQHVALFGWGDTTDVSRLAPVAGTGKCDGGYKRRGKYPGTPQMTKPGSYLLEGGCTGVFLHSIYPGQICYRQIGRSPSRVQRGDSGAAWVARVGNTWLGVAVNHGGTLTEGDAVSLAAMRYSLLAHAGGELQAPAQNTIVKAASEATWLVGPDGFRRRIPTRTIYDCLRAKGAVLSPTTDMFDLETIPEQTQRPASCTPAPVANPTDATSTRAKQMTDEVPRA